jgi:hypothetical protein
MGPRDQLEYFCYQAEQLRQEPLVEQGWDNSFSLNWNRTQGLMTALSQPNETALKSLLLTLRKFVAIKEPTNLARIYKVCEQHITSDELKNYLRDAQSKWKDAQKSLGIAWTHNGRELTPAYVANLWINGHYFHSDQDKLRELRQIIPGELSRFTFLGFIGETLRQVLYADNIIRHALRDGYIKE